MSSDGLNLIDLETSPQMVTTGRTNNEFRSTENRLTEDLAAANEMDLGVDVEEEVERMSLHHVQTVSESLVSPDIVRSSVNEHYGFHQNQDNYTVDREEDKHSLNESRQSIRNNIQADFNLLQSMEKKKGISKYDQTILDLGGKLESIENNGLQIPQSQDPAEQENYLRELYKDIFSSETSKQQENRIRSQSVYGHLKTWKLLRVIVKSGDDLRSEQFAMQLIETIDLIFKKRHLKLKLTPYEILSTDQDCGIVEFIPDAFSIDYIKKRIAEKTG